MACGWDLVFTSQPLKIKASWISAERRDRWRLQILGATVALCCLAARIAQLALLNVFRNQRPLYCPRIHDKVGIIAHHRSSLDQRQCDGIAVKTGLVAESRIPIMHRCLVLAAAFGCIASAAGMTPSVALRGQTAFAAPSAWPKGLAGAEEVVITSRANSLTQSGGRATTTRRSGNVFMMAKTTKRPVSKGFGTAPKIKGNLIVLEDKATVDLFDWLKSGGASVSKVAIADFKGLRGIAARQTIEAGEAIVSVPQELALNLGSDGVNPGYAAAMLCKIEKSEERRAAGWFQPFLNVLPTHEQCDTTDFFNEEELLALEWEPVVEETKSRMAMLRTTYDASQIRGVQKTSFETFSWEEFMWGVYQVVSRVLTIYRNEAGGEKFLIPMIDMFNHDSKSVHELKCTQGQFKVIAGKRINVGEQINILYGGGVLNNDRILQDYGFYIADNELDVKQLISPKTKEPLVGYPFPGMGKTLEDLKQVATMLSSFSTTLEQDETLLATGDFKSQHMRSAIAFRAEKKRAIMTAIKQLS